MRSVRYSYSYGKLLFGGGFVLDNDKSPDGLGLIGVSQVCLLGSDYACMRMVGDGFIRAAFR